MALPDCNCIKGLPQADKLDAIYCVLLEIAQGGGGGAITLSQITDLDASWIAPLQAPLANFSITASQISDSTAFGRAVVALVGVDNGVLATASGANVPGFITGSSSVLIFDLSGEPVQNSGVNAITSILGGSSPAADGTITPVTSITTNAGIITSIS